MCVDRQTDTTILYIIVYKSTKDNDKSALKMSPATWDFPIILT